MAAEALGVPSNGTRGQALVIWTLCKTPAGDQTLKVLVDSGAQANFISQRWAKAYLPESARPPRWVTALDDHRITSYGQQDTTLVLTNTIGMS